MKIRSEGNYKCKKKNLLNKKSKLDVIKRKTKWKGTINKMMI